MSYADATSCGELSRAEIEKLRADGIAVGEIARICGVSRATLYNALSAWGLSRPVGGDHRSKAWRDRHARPIGGGR